MDRENVVYVHTVKYDSAIKKEGNLAIWSNVEDLGSITISEVRQILYNLVYTWNPKKSKRSQIHRERNQICGYHRLEMWGRGNWMKAVKKYELPPHDQEVLGMSHTP